VVERLREIKKEKGTLDVRIAKVKEGFDAWLQQVENTERGSEEQKKQWKWREITERS
jgi:hypothetical protein